MSSRLVRAASTPWIAISAIPRSRGKEFIRPLELALGLSHRAPSSRLRAREGGNKPGNRAPGGAAAAITCRSAVCANGGIAVVSPQSGWDANVYDLVEHGGALDR